MFLQFKGNRKKTPNRTASIYFVGPKSMQSLPRVHLSQGLKTEMIRVIFMFI